MTVKILYLKNQHYKFNRSQRLRGLPEISFRRYLRERRARANRAERRARASRRSGFST